MSWNLIIRGQKGDGGRLLFRQPAPFDRWIEGDEQAIPDASKRGFARIAVRDS
jgi:hypothetical protein